MGSPQEDPDELDHALDDWFVLRGGDLTGSSREKNLRDVYEAYGIWGICATSYSATTAEGLAPSVRCGNKMLMPGMVAELRDKGIDVVKEPSKDWPDALIVFAHEPTPEDWESLRGLMTTRAQIDNPRYRGR